MTVATTITGPRLLGVQQVATKYGVAVRTIWRWESQQRIPRGLRLTRNIVRWREDVIDRHLASLV
jgi:predicted DNA-binding transcriptional regulator AlpA